MLNGNISPLSEQPSEAASNPFRGIWPFATNVRGVNVTDLVAITERRFYVVLDPCRVPEVWRLRLRK